MVSDGPVRLRTLSPQDALPAPGGAFPPDIYIVTNRANILRARRNRAAWGEDGRAIHTRHRWPLEGISGRSSVSSAQSGKARHLREGTYSTAPTGSFADPRTFKGLLA